MNLGEGTRRLALLLGAIGAILGGFASYLELQTVLNQRVRHNRFERLVTSNVVKQERNCRLLGHPPECSKIELAPGATLENVPGFGPPEDTAVKPMGKYTDADIAKTSEAPAKFNMEYVTPPASEINVGEIKAINWTMGKDYGVESIVTKDGQTIYREPSPSAWTYFLIGLYPILGFLILWGAIRAIGWVSAGFVKPVN